MIEEVAEFSSTDLSSGEFDETRETSIGPLTVRADSRSVTAISFGTAIDRNRRGTRPSAADAPLDVRRHLDQAFQQLAEYLAGDRREFDFARRQTGTDFQMRVWRALQEIPFGQTVSYGFIASAIGSPGAARAVGMANNRNSMSIVVPCHRVVGADGRLVGFGGGLDVKERLLELEARGVH